MSGPPGGSSHFHAAWRSVTTSVWNGCETQLSPQSKNRLRPSRTKTLPSWRSSCWIVSGMPKAASRSQRSAYSGRIARTRSYSSSLELVLDAGEAGVAVVEERGEPARQDGEAVIGDAGGEELVEVRGERELELAVLGEELLPAAQVGRRVEELAQALAAVPHQVPAPRGVERDELGHVARVDALEDREQPGLEHVRGGVRLEPQVAVGGRDAQHGRPPAHVRLLDLARPLETLLGEARVDPGGRLGEPAGLHPGEAGIGGDCVGQAASLARGDVTHLFLSRHRHVTGSALRCLPWHKRAPHRGERRPSSTGSPSSSGRASGGSHRWSSFSSTRASGSCASPTRPTVRRGAARSRCGRATWRSCAASWRSTRSWRRRSGSGGA